MVPVLHEIPVRTYTLDACHTCKRFSRQSNGKMLSRHNMLRQLCRND